MVRKILVPVTGFDSDRPAMETALLIGRLFGATLTCLHIRPGATDLSARAAAQDLGSGMVASELFEALRQSSDERARNAKAAFDAFRDAHKLSSKEDPSQTGTVQALWQEREGDEVELAVADGRYHDLVVAGRAPSPSALSMAGVGTLLITCGRPILLAPARAPEKLVPRIAIAWKPTPEAARSVTAAMPILAKADQILIAAANEDGEGENGAERLAALLRAHGMTATVADVVPGERTIPDAVIDTARNGGTDLLVMGGFGHSRVRELVFGGFTRQVLNGCDLPVLFSH